MAIDVVEPAVVARRPASWRSHTFSDGVHAILLAGGVDDDVAAAVRERVGELIARGLRRLIVDATTIGAPGPREQELLAELVATDRRACRVVLVLPWQLALRQSLPADVAVTRTLKEARRLLAPAPAAAPSWFGVAGAHQAGRLPGV